MAGKPVAVDAAANAVETPDPRAFPPEPSEGSVVSLTGHHALFPIDDIVRRLADRALMPSSQISQSERQLIDDVLAALLPKLDYGHRAMLCERFQTGTDVPKRTVCDLAKGDSDLALDLLAQSPALCDLDLAEIMRHGSEAQHIAVARRRSLSAPIVAAFAEAHITPAVLKELLGNESITIPDKVLSRLVDRTESEQDLVSVLMKRQELGPSVALRLFWHAEPKERVAIAKKYSVDRRSLEFGSVPDMKDAIDSLNPETIAALEIIVGPQRKSEFDADEALDAIQHGHAEAFFETVADGAGLSHGLVRKIVADPSGEPLAILCKALRFGRGRFLTVLSLFQKAWGVDADQRAQEERLVMIYDSLSVDRADLILRYWNYAPDKITDH